LHSLPTDYQRIFGGGRVRSDRDVIDPLTMVAPSEVVNYGVNDNLTINGYVGGTRRVFVADMVSLLESE